MRDSLFFLAIKKNTPDWSFRLLRHAGRTRSSIFCTASMHLPITCRFAPKKLQIDYACGRISSTAAILAVSNGLLSCLLNNSWLLIG